MAGPIIQAAGRALGGSTSINGMVWARGHKNDFDQWAAAAGDDRWGYRHVLGIYRRIEDWHGAPDPERRGAGREVFVQPAPNPSPIAPAFLKAAESLRIPRFADQNGIMQEGPGGGAISNVRIRDGRRLNIPASCLYPVMDRPNLTVLTNAFVNRLSMHGAAAVGVEFEWQGALHTIGVTQEVILSAGALQTPRFSCCPVLGTVRNSTASEFPSWLTRPASAGISKIIRSSARASGRRLNLCRSATTRPRPTSS